MKCLVTGGCGFIGSHIVDALLALGHNVAVIDDLSTGHLSNLNKKATFIRGSILDYALVKTVTNKIDWVFHLAAWPRVPRSIKDPLGTHNVNVNGTLALLQAARENLVSKFIYSSSSSVYGDQPTHIMTESMNPNPMSPYALHKFIGEQYATMFAKLFDMRIASLRYFNVYGPRQTTEGAYALVIGKFIRLRDATEPLTVYGDGKQTRAYTFVDDVVRANIMAAQADLPSGQNLILNIGTAEETSVNEVAKKVGGKVVHIVPNPRGEFEERRKAADYTEAKTVIGWEPSVTFDEGMEIL
ncbi:MAG: GDP-mannose 4,6-dehydratase [Chloroflexota bacterium]|nr:GDP-mannose 4,6-dehydratase [Chloroflexota bacterium]